MCDRSTVFFYKILIDLADNHLRIILDVVVRLRRVVVARGRRKHRPRRRGRGESGGAGEKGVVVRREREPGGGASPSPSRRRRNHKSPRRGEQEAVGRAERGGQGGREDAPPAVGPKGRRLPLHPGGGGVQLVLVIRGCGSHHDGG